MAAADFNSEFHSLKRRTMGIATVLLILTLPGVSAPTKLPLLGLDITGVTFDFILAGLAVWTMLDLTALWIEWKEQSDELLEPLRGSTFGKLKSLINDMESAANEAASVHSQLKGAGSFLQNLPDPVTMTDFADNYLDSVARQEMGGAHMGPQFVRTKETLGRFLQRVRHTQQTIENTSAEIASVVVSDLRPVIMKALGTTDRHGTAIDISKWEEVNETVTRLVGANNMLLSNLTREAAGLRRRLAAASRNTKLRAAVLPLGVPAALSLTALAHYVGHIGYAMFWSLPVTLQEVWKIL